MDPYIAIAVIGVEPAVKYSFVKSGTHLRLKGQYKAELTLLPRLYVKPLTTAIRAIWQATQVKSLLLSSRVTKCISQHFSEYSILAMSTE